ncbi:MAG TPA: O-antigen ligase family protein [Chromatiales bacterium]|nr:O-antigen ligase family protein [Chromatiales bacterium]
MVAASENLSVMASIAIWRERTIYALLFLFPLLGVSLDHWFSGIFVIIFLISLPCLFNKVNYQLYPEERMMLYLLAAYFATFILSALVNGWTELQTRYLGVEIRYLAAVPIYLLLRQSPDAAHWLLKGCVLATLLLGLQAYCDIYVLNLYRAEGVYSPNLFGPFAAMIAVLVLAIWQTGNKRKGWARWLLPLLSLSALFAVALSGSRGAYAGLMVMVVVWLSMSLRRQHLLIAFVVVGLGVTAVYNSVDSVQKRVDRVVTDVETYLSIEDMASYEGDLLGNVQRLEIWRTAILIFKQAPFVGVGRGNFEQVADDYADKGLVHASGVKAGHAHSAYLDVLASRGVVGFLVFMAMLLYPLHLFFSTRTQSPDSAMMGIIFLTGFMAFSVTDASTFLKGNFASIFLLYLAAFFSWHVRKVHEAKR